MWKKCMLAVFLLGLILSASSAVPAHLADGEGDPPTWIYIEGN